MVGGLAILALASCGGEPSVYEELLGLVPDTPETRSQVFISDYALMRELFDTPLPGPEDSSLALLGLTGLAATRRL